MMMRLYSTKQTGLHSFYNEVERLTHDIIIALKLKKRKRGGECVRIHSQLEKVKEYHNYV